MVSDDRGQAFSLEGIVAALLLVIALLFAFQAQVITPTTGGGVDAETREQLRTSADDVLFTAADEERGLSWLVRYWDPVTRSYAGDGVPGATGELLDETFARQGQQYNLVVTYRGGNGTDAGTVTIVDDGEPPAGAVQASHAVTLYDNMTLTNPGAGTQELWEYSSDADTDGPTYFPIPDAVEGVVYNVVEVRVVVW